ncbi:unnamed protein product [Lactuca saligna]|uniref:Peptidase C1A papain C-terminal domain-containing protein n=1 Tax=Lactuca saligna TaxID=75948 RepID=A0AA35V7D0_LACSI|nr:unnamed protein product [Lactuca saligna]
MMTKRLKQRRESRRCLKGGGVTTICRLCATKTKKKQYEAFKANLEIVHSTNKAKKSYKLQMNKFAGMTNAEFKSKHTGLKAAPKIRPGKKFVSEAEWPSNFKYRNFTDIPPSVDWTAQGAVTPVKDQGQCGSCFAFATADSIESLHWIKTKQLVELSPKEILDCSSVSPYTNIGCDGGRMHDSYQYVIENKGLTTEKNYPYTPEFGTCNVKKENDMVVEIHGYEQVPFNHEQSLMAAVANQPIQVSIECDEPLVLYKEGIMSAPYGTNIGHAVLLTGYGTDPDGTNYWIIKNSWGVEWGEKGYLRIPRGVPEKEGYAGVNMTPHYPTIEDRGSDHQAGGDPIVQGSKDL